MNLRDALQARAGDAAHAIRSDERPGRKVATRGDDAPLSSRGEALPGAERDDRRHRDEPAREHDEARRRVRGDDQQRRPPEIGEPICPGATAFRASPCRRAGYASRRARARSRRPDEPPDDVRAASQRESHPRRRLRWPRAPTMPSKRGSSGSPIFASASAASESSGASSSLSRRTSDAQHLRWPRPCCRRARCSRATSSDLAAGMLGQEAVAEAADRLLHVAPCPAPRS